MTDNEATVAIEKIAWRINGFFQKLKDKTGFSIKSSFGKEDWNMQLNNLGSSGVHLYFRISSSTKNCKINVIIKQNDGSCFCERYGRYYLAHDMHVITLPNVEEFLEFEKELTTDGYLTITVKISTDSSKHAISLRCPEKPIDSKDSSSQTECLESLDKLSDDFKQLLNTGDRSDVTIVAGNKEFRAHKLVLSARSPVLKAMFSSDMIENNTGILTIHDCDGNIFQDVLTFIYSGKLDKLGSSRVAALYPLSDQYNLDSLKSECVKHLIDNMSVDSVCDALHVAALYEETRLLEVATNFFVDNADPILDTLTWKKFLKEHTETGNELTKKYIENIKQKK